MSQIYNEDCLVTLNRGLEYDYIITSPPDLDEIGFSTDKTGVQEYIKFLDERISKFNPQNNVVTIINRDRKTNGTVLRKHNIMCDVMFDHGWVLKTQKIWVRSYKANLYRYNYSFIQTFKRGKCDAKGEQSIPDAFFCEVDPIGTYKDNYPPEIITKFIEIYCRDGGKVFDPFMGSGSTAVAAKSVNRNYDGAEIIKDVYELCINRLSTEFDEKFMNTIFDERVKL